MYSHYRVSKQLSDIIDIGGEAKIVAFVVGNTVDCAKELYNKTKQVVGNISRIYTDGNGMYKSAFSDFGVSNLHFVARGKFETHYCYFFQRKQFHISIK